MSEKMYLGNSVYAEKAGSVVVLTTENGLPDDPSNIIFLEPDTTRALQGFLTKHGF